MKKVLFTIQWYGIPANIAASANSLCDTNVINELKKNKDYEIHTLSYAVEGFPIEEIIDGIYVHRFKRSWWWNKFILSRNHISNWGGRLLYYINRMKMRVQQLIFTPFFPNYEPFLINHFEKEALRLHKIHHFDIVISEFNGFDSLSAGAKIKKAYSGTKFLPIFWDSLSGGRLAKWMPAKYCRHLRRKAETRIMNIADKAIAMSSSLDFHNNNSVHYDYFNKFEFLDVPYLTIDTSSNNEVKGHMTGTRLKLLYSGTMADRNPKKLFEILNRTNKHIDFLFICPKQYHNDVVNESKEFDNISVRCLPYMSHDELTKYQIECDILVNFGIKNPNAISGKIFDYMRLGKPIISTASIDNEACIKYLKEYPISLILDERKDIKHNTKMLDNFIELYSDYHIDLKEISKCFHKNTPQAYVKVISTLIEHGR